MSTIEVAPATRERPGTVPTTCVGGSEMPDSTESSPLEGIVSVVGSPDRCFGCERRKSDMFMDSRTGNWFCAECLSALLSWEFDGCPDDPDLPYRDWIADE